MSSAETFNKVEMTKFNIRRLDVDIEYHSKCLNDSTAYLQEVILYEKNNMHILEVVEGSKKLRETIERDIMNHTRLRDKAVGEKQRLLQRLSMMH